MQEQANAVRAGTLVAHGYGLKIYVDKGHLVVHEGIGRNRSTLRLNRATSRLKRLFVIGHTGFVTLEALRWLSDTGAAFAQIGADGQLIASSAPARNHESQLRRAQVRAADNLEGRIATVALLRDKLHAQAGIADRLAHLKPTVRLRESKPVAVSDAIREWAAQLTPDLTFEELRRIESSAGRNYWQVWAHVAPVFDASWVKSVPDHWLRAGPRTSKLDRKRARSATTPVHALLNYGYGMLEVETTIAAHAVGFDPSLGIMHADVRYRGSLSADLMEPARPAVDAAVLDLLETRHLKRGDVFETRGGVCRVGAALARELAGWSPALRVAVSPHAEELARTITGSAATKTVLTRRNHRRAVGATTRRGADTPTLR